MKRFNKFINEDVKFRKPIKGEDASKIYFDLKDQGYTIVIESDDMYGKEYMLSIQPDDVEIIFTKQEILNFCSKVQEYVEDYKSMSKIV